MARLKLEVSGMNCGGCANSVRTILSDKLGVEKDRVDVRLDDEAASVELNTAASAEKLDAALFELQEQGFPSKVVES
jgi:copper chaperone CopZ